MEVIQALICIWEMGMLFYAAFQLLPQRRMHVITKIIWWICVALDTGLLIYQRSIVAYSRGYLLVCILFSLLVIKGKYKISFWKSLCGTAIYFETLYLLDLFISVGFSILIQEKDLFKIELFQTKSMWLITFGLSRALMMGCILFLTFKSNMIKGVFFSSKIFAPIIVVIEYMSLVQCDIVFTSGKLEKGTRNCLLFAGLYLLVLVSIIVYYGYQQSRHQVELLIERNKVMEQEYAGIVAWSRERSALVHDAKNHLIFLEGMIVSGEQERALTYIKKLLSSEDEYEQIFYTDDLVLNYLLNQKMRMAKGYGIKIKLCIDKWNNPFIADEDLCVIVANLLDNAIEALKDIKGKEKKIIMEVKEFSWGAAIIVENNCGETKEESSIRPKTTKKNSREHGIGLQNVETAVKKYGGKVQYERRNKIFHVDIILYRP